MDMIAVDVHRMGSDTAYYTCLVLRPCSLAPSNGTWLVAVTAKSSKHYAATATTAPRSRDLHCCRGARDLGKHLDNLVFMRSQGLCVGFCQDLACRGHITVSIHARVCMHSHPRSTPYSRVTSFPFKSTLHTTRATL